MDKAKSKILVIGASGYIGKSIVEASALAGHQTFALIQRASLSDPAKAQTLAKFSSLGVNFVHGYLYDHESLLNAVKLVDVVVSTLFRYLIPHQLNIIAAIKEAGNVNVLLFTLNYTFFFFSMLNIVLLMGFYSIS